MSPWTLCRVAAVLLLGVVLLDRSQPGAAAVGDYTLADQPLYLGGNAPPLMMLVASRDEQLFDKAYTDYTDISGDGVVDNTYNNRIDYEGYFDPFLCYVYASGVFKAKPERNTDHKCGGSAWSGNFLNWITMSRLDVLRYVLYGGMRTTDTATDTVLERAHIPSDMHAWSKIYTGDDLQQYVGIAASGKSMTFCNVSLDAASAPLMRVAQGRFPSWGVTEFTQCIAQTGASGVSEGNGDRPTTITDFTVRVRVCDPALASDASRESFCQRYGTSFKPVGLLQEFGESGRLRFGLVSGSYSAPRAGGVLRKNIGRFAGNGSNPAACAVGDEVRLSDGTFCNQAAGNEGIVNTLNRFRLVAWNGSNTAWNGTSWAGDCGGWGATNRTDIGSSTITDPGSGYACTPWGNPIGEMYAEALRYLAGQTTATAAFVANPGNDISGGPRPAWRDPYGAAAPASQYGGGNPYCADCSVMILSSGTNTYDGNAVPAVPGLQAAAAATDALGSDEGINGKRYFVGFGAQAPNDASMTGNLAYSHRFVCSSTLINNLSYVRGICDDTPNREGSYLIGGLAKAASSTDLRPGLPGKPATVKVDVTTYAVALADSLPKIEIKAGGGTLSLTPYCVAYPDASYEKTCQLGDTLAGAQPAANGVTYGRDVAADGSAGSFMFSWDGAPEGESNDRDFVYMLTYCVGAACNADTNAAFDGADICWGSASAACSGSNNRPIVGANEVLVRTELIGVSSGDPLYVGFGVFGGNRDGTYRAVYRPPPPNAGSAPPCNGCAAGAGFNLLTNATPNGTNYRMTGPVNNAWRQPSVERFAVTGAASGSLPSPLWYAAKYGAADANGDGRPDWDTDGDGQPDNYLMARNPAKLKSQLRALIGKALGSAPTSGGSSSGARLATGSSFTLQSSFRVPDNSADWTGDLAAYELNADGTRGPQRWSAATRLAGRSAGSRNIRTTMASTVLGGNGSVHTMVAAREFTASNLAGYAPASTARARLGLGLLDELWLKGQSDANLVDYLRGGLNAAPFRVRSALLGDIVNSSVEIVSAGDDYGYGAWDGAASPAWKSALGKSYKAFLQGKNANKTTAYAGANDGMLHAFDATAAGGGERFAYIPSTARERMGQLANPNYRHAYTMDGEIVSADVPAAADGNWRTLLVAGAGAGGRSVSALDVTDPDRFGDASVLWELRGTDGSHAVLDDLGHVFGRPLIVPVSGPSGPRWIALFGNGANSYAGAPVLFAVDANTGEVLARLKPAASAYAQRNGLINLVALARYNSDGLVDTVYGGDLQGNLWKFDLSAANAASWNIALGGQPLFSAKDANGNAQPITGGLDVASGPGGGVAVYFGTGRYFASGDESLPANPPVQSLYAVYDRCAAADCTARIAGRASLGEQALQAQTADAAGNSSRSVSQVSSGNDGWFLDLKVGATGNGERFIGVPRLQSGKVFFTSFEVQGDDCKPGVRNWRYGLDMYSGAGAFDGLRKPGGDAACPSGGCGAYSGADDTGAPDRSTDIYLLKPPPQPRECATGSTDPACQGTPGAGPTDPNQIPRCQLTLEGQVYMDRPCGRQSWRQVR
ncbi:pilus assembly protein [Lysobacter silvisoli]|uniref:Pilus assembly protein PilC n=1 Tax=Lysobacter silvisoli TaxID=2293254 RepID=A0A371K5N7_9GAMM|nr:PilC/PilY family type IV pilus protein [Lysobacter silvisoli]RDZ29249.1 pilus assembly protein PilC [Lysobacter silvisoli]